MAIRAMETAVSSLEEFEKVSHFIQNRFHFRGRRAVNRGAPSPDHRRYLYRCTDKCSGTDVISYQDGVARAFTRSVHVGDPKCPVLHQLDLEKANWTRISSYRIDTDISTEFPNYFRTKLRSKEDCIQWAADYRRATGFVMRMNDARDRKFGFYVIGKCMKDCGVTMIAVLNPFCEYTFVRVNGEHNHGGQNFSCPSELAEEITALLETNPNPPRVFENYVYNKRNQCNSIDDFLNKDFMPSDVVVKHLGRKLKDKYKASGEYMRVKIPGKATQTVAQPLGGSNDTRGCFVYVKGENERPIVVDLCNRISDILNHFPTKELYKLSKSLSNEDDNAFFKSKIANWGQKGSIFTGFPVELENLDSNPDRLIQVSNEPRSFVGTPESHLHFKRPVAASPFLSPKPGVKILVRQPQLPATPGRTPFILKMVPQNSSDQHLSISQDDISFN